MKWHTKQLLRLGSEACRQFKLCWRTTHVYSLIFRGSMSESCKQPESSGIGTRGMLQDTHSFCFLNNAGHSHVFRHLEHTHTDTRAPATLPNSLSLSHSLALLSPPSLGLHHISSSWRVQHSISEQSREEGRAGRVALCGPSSGERESAH